MILDIRKSKLFTSDPDVRFAIEYAVPEGTWHEVWRRHKLLGYTGTDIKDFVFIKFARNLSYSAINRWVFRTEIFSITAPLIKKGVQHVNSSIFNEFESDVINEVTLKMKKGESASSRTVI